MFLPSRREADAITSSKELLSSKLGDGDGISLLGHGDGVLAGRQGGGRSCADPSANCAASPEIVVAHKVDLQARLHAQFGLLDGELLESEHGH